MNKEICFSDLPLLTHSIGKNVEQLMEYGADKIELLMDGIEWDEMDEQIKRMAAVFRQYQVGYTVHPPAWDTNLTSENRAIRQASYDEYRKAIEFAHAIEAEHVVIHPGFCFSPVFDKAIARKRAAAYINELCRVAAPLGVKIAVENVGYKGTSIVTEEEFGMFLDDVDETAGYLIDTGHAHLNGWNIPAVIRRVNDRLFAVHLHDNSAEGDEHLPIGEGTIHWEPIYGALKELGSSCQLILEYAPGTDLSKLTYGKEILKHNLGL
ncbi:sugar phosphate isomerase/epimerase [Aneurinibacillus sp. Ricciae_BoGa-3]|uniref:sugar phosphate isomerase/epimerase family protein n=1 Tax=Aneurinibacillus sp. Ricciae_BoGa-3 TaxID=3022697 RepID=UPI0023408190|nr:sugar phosphate isomerase/epimerase family protein [Aneurinibacillus sp. Ricciae_BoGa-3]WCK54321.1 sugar phosphate isomerase/epimerase [Aneurinibacillus sp. Ricciae_BoGa-3]